MKTQIKTFAGMMTASVLFTSFAAAQNPTPSGAQSLDATLCRSVCERVQAPMVFSTRDSLFALSLPTDEPATIFLQVTVGKNGKVKEKLTRVDANHLAGYVAPAFLAAVKDLRVDRGLLNGKDTSLLLAFPMEYQCVYDTTVLASRANKYPYQSRLFYDNFITSWWQHNQKFKGDGFSLENPYINSWRLPKLDSYSGPVSFYIVFLAIQPE